MVIINPVCVSAIILSIEAKSILLIARFFDVSFHIYYIWLSLFTIPQGAIGNL